MTVTTDISLTYAVVSILLGILLIKPTWTYFQLQKSNKNHVFFRKRHSKLVLITLVLIIWSLIIQLPISIVHFTKFTFLPKNAPFIADAITNTMYPPLTQAIIYICACRYLFLLFCNLFGNIKLLFSYMNLHFFAITTIELLIVYVLFSFF